MNKDKNSKIYDLNEYGELAITSKEKEKKEPISWQARFLKAMIVLFLVTVLLITILNH
jgi:hypothetical protein